VWASYHLIKIYFAFSLVLDSKNMSVKFSPPTNKKHTGPEERVENIEDVANYYISPHTIKYGFLTVLYGWTGTPIHPISTLFRMGDFF
jgi:hypothetical protein